MQAIVDGIPRMAEVRAIINGVGSSQARRTTPRRHLSEGKPDETILDLLDEPFRTANDAYERLVRLEAYLRGQNDRRSVFLTVYVRMTAAVRDQIDAGFFTDPDWTREYLITFAEHYRQAVVAFERHAFDAVPPPWQIAFAASGQEELLVAQDALLGVNAHINYDLTYALREVALDPHRDAKRRDHDRINEILRRLIDIVQEVLVDVYGSRTISDVDTLLGRTDEHAAFVGLEHGRQFAWRNAVLLTDLPWRPVTQYVDWRVRTVSTGTARILVGADLDRPMRDESGSADAAGRTVSTFHDAFEEHAPEEFPQG